ncbi:MAG: enoyl-CoA hydratase [Betaproteobacteria bacterium]|nr:enoyl-CoA hydratase [Betaproteobacteria bacterium]
MDDLVLVDLQDHIATLTLNRPQALNALSVAMMQALRRAVDRVAANAEVYVVVIRGAGGHFMAGGDIREFHGMLHLSPAARLPTFKAMIEQWINPTVASLRGMHQPVIAQVEGACAGFGLSLMLACDLAVCADDAYFATAYAQIGLSPDGGQTQFLQRTLGTRKATELLLLSERFPATEALRLGLVNRVVPAAQLDSEVASLAARLRDGARHAFGEIKRLLGSAPESSLVAQLQTEAEAFGRCSATQDFAEGTTAFVEKRRAVFGGR